MKKISTLLYLFLFLSSTTIAQTSGIIDSTFNVLDNGSNFSLLDSDPYALAIQPDNKILLGGYFDDVNGKVINRLVRLSSNGNVDNTFDAGTGPSGPVFDIKIQTNGKVLVGGNFSTFNGNSNPDIIRLNSDGSIDSTFSSGTGTDSPVETIAIQSDGKILIGGDFTSYNGNNTNGIARLNSDGTFDNTFDPGNGADDMVRVIAVQSDGKVIVGGDFNTFDTQARTKLVRLNSDGSVDLTYDVTILGSNVRVESLVIEPDGDLIIGGAFATVEGSVRSNIARVDNGGNLDSGFSILLNNTVNSIALMTNGKIIIGGAFTSANGNDAQRITKLNADGTSDPTFTSVEGPDNTVRKVMLDSNDDVFICGAFTEVGTAQRNRVTKLMSNGLDDPTFASTTGANGTVYTLAVQPDGKIVVGGYFTSMNGVSLRRIARLNTDGTLDTNFDPGTGFNGTVWSVQIQTNGKILVGGYFTEFNGVVQNRITRLNEDGSRDSTFNVAGNGADEIIYRVALQPDGKILAGGFFTSFNSETHNRIVRLNADGTIDGTFNEGIGADGNIWDIKLQNDGKVLLGGFFTSFDGKTRNRIARLNNDGSLDDTFDPGTGPDGNIYKMAIQSDGKILIGGLFQNMNGNSQNRLARLNTDGTHDMSFDIGTGFNNNIRALHIQADGKILVGGLFSSFNGNSEYGIIRLNADGSNDDTFDNGFGVDGSVYEINQQQTDSKILVGGSFTIYNGKGKNRVMRLLTETITGLEIAESNAIINVYPNPAKNSVNWDNIKVQIAELIDCTGRSIITLYEPNGTMDISSLSDGIYILRLYAQEKIYTSRVLKHYNVR